MKKYQKILALLLAVCMLACMFTACSKPADTANDVPKAEDSAVTDASNESETKGEPVVLDWYLALPPQDKQDDVFAAINEILLDELNIQVNFHIFDFGTYGQQMQMLMTSGQKIDMMYTSNWTNDFYSDVSKGAYQEIDMSLIEQYGPNILAEVPAGAWDAARVEGKLLAIPNVQVLARWPSVLIQNRFAEQYGFDLSSVQNLEDLTPLLQSIADNDKDMYAIDINKNTNILSYYASNMGLEYISESSPFGIRIDDASLEVTNIYNTDEMLSFMKLLRSWYESGIIRKDAASVTDVTAEKQNGKLAAIFCVNNPDTLVNQAKAMNLDPAELTMIPLSDPYLSTSSVVATMTAINVNSQYQKECIEVLNKFFDAEDTRCINLLSYGIEGVNYNKVEDDLIEQIPNSGYWIDCGWAYGSIFNCLRTNAAQPAWRPAGPDINANATTSPIMGFSFNPEPVKNELAQIAAVMDEFVPSLMTGSVDVESTLTQFNEKLAQAGADKVQAEIQTQLNAWLETK